MKENETLELSQIYYQSHGWLDSIGIIIASSTAIIGIIIAIIIPLIQHIRQSKYENTFRILQFLRNNITDEHIKVFTELFYANNHESSGHPKKYVCFPRWYRMFSRRYVF